MEIMEGRMERLKKEGKGKYGKGQAHIFYSYFHTIFGSFLPASPTS
jgi:hypothetical protein